LTFKVALQQRWYVSKEFQDTEHVPDLSKEEIGAIEEAGFKLHQGIFMRHIFND